MPTVWVQGEILQICCFRLKSDRFHRNVVLTNQQMKGLRALLQPVLRISSFQLLKNHGKIESDLLTKGNNSSFLAVDC